MKEWKEFEDRIEKITANFMNQEIPRPPFWSGFRVVPKRIEFWEEGDFRIHKRQVYIRFESGWEVKKIYP